MTDSTREPMFLRRFERLWSSLRRYQVQMGLCGAVLAALVGLAILAGMDYRWELPWTNRATGLAIAGAVVLMLLWRGVAAPLKWWTQPRTAIEIEGRYPQLGQRIRTVVQYAGQPEEIIASEGVAPSLVDALEKETAIQVEPLPLDDIIPWWRVRFATMVAMVPAVLLVGAGLFSVEWRTALQRALLSHRPYTTMVVGPGNVMVEQGDNVRITIELKGRVKRDVVLYTRSESGPNAPWTEEKLEPPEKGPKSKRTFKLEKVQKPVEYRVVAGPAASKAYRVGVRYPLAIKSFDVALKPPTYTGVDPSTVKGGNLTVIEGTDANFKVALDTPPAAASMILSETSVDAKGKKTTSERVIPLQVKGAELTAALNLTKDLSYRIEARSSDGRVLPKTKYRIDVREDRPPRVVFDSPDEALEVHPIAEVFHRIRAGDDFGLTKAGIVYRADDGEEKTLIIKDFAAKNGKPQTTAALQQTLLLETLAMTPTRSVTYYAFAEDNYPKGARRSESDLRYIDIRPFKREYKYNEPMGGGEDDDEQFATLEELIARQRFNLNRTVRLAKHRPNDLTSPEDPLKIAGFEETLAGLTREFTEGVENIAGQRVDSLHTAEGAMLAAVEALDRRKDSEAVTREAEALRSLVEARDTLQQFLGPDAQMRRAMRNFDRKQAQKIRKPKSKEQEADAIADEIEALADEEQFNYASIAALAMAGEDETKGQGETGEKSEEAEKSDKDAEKKKDEAEKKDSDESKDSPKGEKGAQGKEGPKGQKGQKGTKGSGQGESGEGGEPKAGEKGEQEKGEKPEGSDGQKKEDGQEGENKEKGQAGENKENGPDGEGKEGDPGQKKGAGKKPGKEGMGENDEEKNGGGGLKAPNRREVAEKQERIADDAHDLDDKLKKIELASDLAKSRMSKATAKVDEANGALVRGNTKEASEAAKKGAGMLHEVARQVKGELAKEVADELAMARDLADELSDLEAELAELPPGSPSDGKGNDGSDGKEGENPQSKGQKGSKGKGDQGSSPGNGRGGLSGWGNLTEAERLERLAEAALTLETWLKDIEKKGEGKTAESIREMIEEGKVADVVERTERMGALYLGGHRVDVKREAGELAKNLEVMSRSLDVIHREIVAPRLAELVAYDQRAADLLAKMATLTTKAEVNEWHRQVAALLAELEKKEGMTDGAVADLRAAMDAAGWDAGGGNWHFGNGHWVVPGGYSVAVRNLSVTLQQKIQDLILKDLVSARDESTPPEFKELVERYYEVLSKNGGVR